MRKKQIPKDSDKIKNVGKLKTVIEFETGNTADEEKVDIVETKTVESTPAVLEVSRSQAVPSEMNEDTPIQEK